MKTNKYHWVSCDDNREISFITSSITAVRPKLTEENTPLFCPICDWSMTTIDDFLSFKEFACCSWCEFKFARLASNKQNWLAGLGQPTVETLNNALAERMPPSFTIK